MNGLIARLSTSLAIVLMAVLLALMGLGFLAFALYLALIERFSPAMAALLTGLAAFLVAALAIAIGGAINTAAKRKQRRDAERFAVELTDLLSDEFLDLASTHPQATALGALLAGFAVGIMPKLRNVLRELLRRR